jgi:hypothetical protein
MLHLLCFPYKFRTLAHSLPIFHFAFSLRSFLLSLFFSFVNPLFDFLKMPKGGGEDSDGLGDAHPAMWESKLSKADERRI